MIAETKPIARSSVYTRRAFGGAALWVDIETLASACKFSGNLRVLKLLQESGRYQGGGLHFTQIVTVCLQTDSPRATTRATVCTGDEMSFDSLTEDLFVQRLIAAGIVAIFTTVAIVIGLAFGILAGRLSRGTTHVLASRLIGASRLTIVLLLASAGIFFGLAALPDAEPWYPQIHTGWVVIATIIAAYGISSVTRAGIGLYIDTVAPKTKTQFDNRMLPLISRILSVTIYGIALLILLEAMGWAISPILGGLGITGLAVALALQPTLSNFFAGTYILSEGTISVGDYIELQGGPAGYVVEVGWRSTKIRTWLNNLVLIPNSVMGDSVITNYSAPDPAMNVLLGSGVSYDSDLDRVERVSLEVARTVVSDNPAAVKGVEPFFGFERFADSNIEFWIFVQAKDRFGSFSVMNQLVKRLHQRFAEEGIEINYPVRRIITDKTSGREEFGGN